MKTKRNISMLLACLAGVCLFSSQATAGTLIGSTATAPATVNLTAEGTLDWAHWGLNVATDFDQKEGGTNQISNFTLIGPAPDGPYQYGNALVAYSWSDGTPDTTAAGTTTGVYFNGLNNGYQITVPADTTKRILRVYAGGWDTTVHFGASLSDQSAPDYVDESLVTAGANQAADAYTLMYAAASAGQTLTITVYCVTSSGNCTLMAASLFNASPNILNPPASQMDFLGYSAHFTVQAEGWSPLAYQWWRESNGVYAPLADGGQISGSTTPSLTINNLVPANATNYIVTVTNAYGAVTSTVAALTTAPVTGVLNGNAAPAPATADLTAQGTLDWAHWGLNVATDFDDKEGGGNQISNITLFGPSQNGPFQYGNALVAYSWTDGTPDTTAADTATGIYFNNLTDGYEITVPADTTKRILRVYAGGWNSTVHLDAALSDQSAPPYIDESLVTAGANQAANIYTIDYAAASAGQTLTITVYNLTSGGNCTLMAATLSGPSPTIVNPPASQTAYLGYSAQLTVQAEGWSPLAYQWWRASNGVYAPLADGGQISGSTTPTLTISNLAAANATNYIVTVTNLYGAVTSTVAALTAAPITGTLNGSAAPAPATVNLTAEGTLDWAHWGLNVATDFDQKQGGTNQISNLTLIGPSQNGPFQYGGALVAYSWSDGTPDPTAADTATGVYFNNFDDGYQITVPADTTKRILNVYAGGWNTTIHFEASLSDESAPPYIDESLVTPANGSLADVYTIEYAAASAAQTLTITVYGITGNGNCTLMAATLNGPEPRLTGQPASQTNWTGQNVQFSVSALGWPVLAYQWWQEANGVYVALADSAQASGSTTPTLTISNLVSANATNYYVVVTNAYGAVTSSVASLAVLPTTGTLEGNVLSLYSPTDSVNAAPTNIIFNLTEEGTLDWIKWNSSNNGGGGPFVNAFDQKIGGANQISDASPYGSTSIYYDGFQAGPLFSWNDGTPDLAANATNWDFCNCGLNNGLQFTVSADTTTKYLRVYAGIYGGGLTCEATLSDNSAAPYIDSSVLNGHDNLSFNVYTIQFAAHSAGQTLTITLYVNYEGYDGQYASANLQAASLRSTPFPAVLPPLALQSSRSGSSLRLTWPYGTLLQATNVTGPWTTTAFTSPYTVTPSGPRRFYRVQVQ